MAFEVLWFLLKLLSFEVFRNRNQTQLLELKLALTEMVGLSL